MKTFVEVILMQMKQPDGAPRRSSKGIYSKKKDKAELKKASFKKAILCSAQFRESKLNEAVLVKSDCSEANFKLADLRGADFTGAKLIKTKFEGAQVHGTILKDSIFGDNDENFQVDISPGADKSMMITVQEWFKMYGSKR